MNKHILIKEENIWIRSMRTNPFFQMFPVILTITNMDFTMIQDTLLENVTENQLYILL